MSSLPLNRRDMLAGIGAGALALTSGAWTPAAAVAQPLPMGSALDWRDPDIDPQLLALLAQTCTALVPENAGKWKWIQPLEGRMRWDAMDRTAGFAQDQGLKLNWHVLLWQNGGMPNYMKLPSSTRPSEDPRLDPYYAPDGGLSPENYKARFDGFLNAIAGRYGDRFWRVDVANEIFLGDDAADSVAQDAYGMRKGNWWQTAGGAEGPAWLDPFFSAAHAAFPSAHLVINEFGIEAPQDNHRRKRQHLLDWLQGAVARGCPVDGVGLQSHLIASQGYDSAGMRDFANQIAALGLEIHITELDVNGQYLPGSLSVEEKRAQVAARGALHVDTLKKSGALREVTWWGLRSDVAYNATRYGSDLQVEPTPFDASGMALPLYTEVRQVMENGA